MLINRFNFSTYLDIFNHTIKHNIYIINILLFFKKEFIITTKWANSSEISYKNHGLASNIKQNLK